MTKLSKHFSRHEFACRCGCGFDVVDAELLQVLEDVREHFGEPVTINSAARCVQNNIRVGGMLTSRHLLGIACDIVVHSISPILVHDYLCTKYPEKYGIGFYEDFTHIDVREKRGRW